MIFGPTPHHVEVARTTGEPVGMTDELATTTEKLAKTTEKAVWMTDEPA